MQVRTEIVACAWRKMSQGGGVWAALHAPFRRCNNLLAKRSFVTELRVATRAAMGCTQSVRPDVRDDATEVPQTRETSVSIETRFVPLEDLKQHGRFPRFGSSSGFVHPVTGDGNANLCRSRDSFDALSTIFIFVSHRWLRSVATVLAQP